MKSVAIDLWTWPLDIPAAEMAALAAALSEEEQARASRFVFDIHANRYKAGRGRLRQILGSYLAADPAAVTFSYGANGKPELSGQFAETPWRFNLSHSAGLAALAVCRDIELGIDVEFIRPIEDDVAKFHFSPNEYAVLSRLEGAAWLDGFYRCWTRKEAMVKALGDGLSLPLDSFDVTLRAEEPALLTRLEGDANAAGNWVLHHFQPEATCIGAIALRSEGTPIEVTHRTA